VKLLKRWNGSRPGTVRLKSFAIETMAARIFKDVALPTLQDGVRIFFDFIAWQADNARLYKWSRNYGVQLNWWTHEVQDLAGTGSNLVAKVDAARRKKFVECAAGSRDILVKAEKARTLESARRHIGAALRML
jgi:hypothetical protein